MNALTTIQARPTHSFASTSTPMYAVTLPTTANDLHTETAAPESTRRATSKRHTAPEHVETLHPSQLLNVARAEIEWFYTSAPSQSPARAIVQSWLGTLDVTQQRALALWFDPEPWPAELQAEGLESGYALAVSIASSSIWQTKSRPHHEIHRNASATLRAAIQTRGVAALRGISRRAEWDFDTALRAYAAARGRAPSVLPR